jgi:hypothetical protein
VVAQELLGGRELGTGVVVARAAAGQQRRGGRPAAAQVHQLGVRHLGLGTAWNTRGT